MLTYFLVSQWQLVCWGVLGSDAGSSVFHPLESSCMVKLVPKMAMLGDETSKG